MTEICENCPIRSTDPDAPALCAAASEMTNSNGLFSDAFDDSDALAPEEYHGSDDPYTAELVAHAMDFPTEKLAKARLCAQQILWKTCEFENLT